MKIIELKPVAVSPEVLLFLERRNLIRRLKAPRKVLNARSPGGAMQTLYCSASRFGAHKLICVKKNSPRIKLTYHPDNEEFIVINNSAGRFKPLYMVMGLHKYGALVKKLKEQSLNAKDFIALRLKYNDPQTSIFTMLKNTPHCELTEEGKGSGPVFFVAEPSRLKTRSAKLNGCRCILKPCLQKPKE